MKKYLIIVLVCLLSGFGFAQNIKEFSSYVEAMQQFQVGTEEEKLMVIFYSNGKNSSFEKKIKKQILKPSILKQFGKDVVLLHVDASKGQKAGAYNSRAILGYNAKRIFPSVKVYIPGHRKQLPLQISFSDEEISNFLSEIKSL